MPVLEPTHGIIAKKHLNWHVVQHKQEAYDEGHTLRSEAGWAALQQQVEDARASWQRLERRLEKCIDELQQQQQQQQQQAPSDRSTRAAERRLAQAAANVADLERKVAVKKRELARLEQVEKVQRNVRAVRTAWLGASAVGAPFSFERAMAEMGAFYSAFDAKLFLLKLDGPRVRKINSWRLGKSELQLRANFICDFAANYYKSQGNTGVPVIVWGDCVQQQKLVDLVAKRCRVFGDGEFRSTGNCRDCGSTLVCPNVGKARAGCKSKTNKGALRCTDGNCRTQGRFQHRDVVAACSIVDVFVCSKLMGGSLGGFSRCAGRTPDKTRLVDLNERLSLLRVFHG